jgi:uncharacterized protein (DUF1778 family)
MSTRTARIELRATPANEKRLRYAASLTRQSLSAFMLEASTKRAERVITEATRTELSPAFFDVVWAALDIPPASNQRLKRVARRTRRVRQLP